MLHKRVRGKRLSEIRSEPSAKWQESSLFSGKSRNLSFSLKVSLQPGHCHLEPCPVEKHHRVLLYKDFRPITRSHPLLEPRDLIYPTSACPHAKMLPPPLRLHLRQLMEATTKRLKQTIQMVKISCLFTNEKKNSHQFLAHFCPSLTLFHILSLPNPILFVKTRCHFSTSLIFP